MWTSVFIASLILSAHAQQTAATTPSTAPPNPGGAAAPMSLYQQLTLNAGAPANAASAQAAMNAVTNQLTALQNQALANAGGGRNPAAAQTQAPTFTSNLNNTRQPTAQLLPPPQQQQGGGAMYEIPTGNPAPPGVVPSAVAADPANQQASPEVQAAAKMLEQQSAQMQQMLQSIQTQ